MDNISYTINDNLSDINCMFDENPPSTLQSYIFPTTVYLMYSIVFLISICGNGIVCYMVITTPRMQTVTNYFIMNLAIGDILITILCIPFTTISTLLQYWPFNALLCPVVNYSQGVSVFVSSYTLVAISLDRYVAIMWPLKPRLAKSSSMMIIIFVWLIATLTALPIALMSTMSQPIDFYKSCDIYVCKEDWSSIGIEYEQMYSKAILILQYVIPLSVLLFTYTNIAIVIWCHRIPGEAENCRDLRMARSKRKMIKMMITVVVVYTICWLPINLLWILIETDLDGNVKMYIWFASHWFAMSHTCYNPIIYCYMNTKFRAGFREIFGMLPCFTSIFIHHHRHHHHRHIDTHESPGNFPLTSVIGTENTILHRNNTCTTFISTRRMKSDSRYTSINSLAPPVRSASLMRNNHHIDNSSANYKTYNLSYRHTTNVLENQI